MHFPKRAQLLQISDKVLGGSERGAQRCGAGSENAGALLQLLLATHKSTQFKH